MKFMMCSQHGPHVRFRGHRLENSAEHLEVTEQHCQPGGMPVDRQLALGVGVLRWPGLEFE